jgi:hypothetical protein
MLYTWKFAETACGWKSPADFDPVVFARVSDPSVGEEHCPWSDWHGDTKVRDLSGHDMEIVKRQPWQDDLFIWYALEFKKYACEPLAFFSPSKFQEGDIAAVLPVHECESSASRVFRRDHGLLVETAKSNFSYALVSPVYKVSHSGIQPNTLRADISLLEGGLSIGVLDVASETFANSAFLTKIGRNSLLVSLPPNVSAYRIILSNYHPKCRDTSSFLLHRLELIKRPSVIEQFRL